MGIHLCETVECRTSLEGCNKNRRFCTVCIQARLKKQRAANNLAWKASEQYPERLALANAKRRMARAAKREEKVEAVRQRIRKACPGGPPVPTLSEFDPRQLAAMGLKIRHEAPPSSDVKIYSRAEIATLEGKISRPGMPIRKHFLPYAWV